MHVWIQGSSIFHDILASILITRSKDTNKLSQFESSPITSEQYTHVQMCVCVYPSINVSYMCDRAIQGTGLSLQFYLNYRSNHLKGHRYLNMMQVMVNDGQETKEFPQDYKFY